MLLVKASITGDIMEVRRLVEKYKVDINEIDMFGHTPLYYAIVWENKEVVQFFIKYCYKIQISAIEFMCKSGELEFIASIIGMNSINDRAILYFACIYDQLNIVEFLIKKTHIKLHDNFWQSPSCPSVIGLPNRKYGISLLQANDKHRWHNLQAGYTALTAACAWDSLSVVQYLIEAACASVNCKDGNQRTALDVACDMVSLKVIKYFLDNPALINRITRDGWDHKLFTAPSINEWLDIVEYLLDNTSINFFFLCNFT